MSSGVAARLSRSPYWSTSWGSTCIRPSPCPWRSWAPPVWSRPDCTISGAQYRSAAVSSSARPGEAVGTCLVVIAINCAAGFLANVRHAAPDARLTLLVTLLAVGGSIVGARLSHRIEVRRLQVVFAVFVLVVGAVLVFENIR